MLAFLSILYKPSENAILNIKTAKKLGIYPIVYQNEIETSYLEELEKLDIKIIGKNINVGLGPAFFESEDYIKKNAIKHYIYFDQDTIVTESAWINILNSYEGFFSEIGIGMLFYGKSKASPLLVTSSGSLFSMKVICEIGKHDKSFFVESVDYEFCLRLKAHNLRIKNLAIEGIDHLTLQDKEQKRVFGTNIQFRCYGWKRWVDFNNSHYKLIGRSLSLKEFRMSILFIKSAIIFNIKEVYSRLLRAIP